MKKIHNYKDYVQSNNISFNYVDYFTIFKLAGYDQRYQEKVCFRKLIDNINENRLNDMELTFSVKICLTDRYFVSNKSHLCLIGISDIRKYVKMLSKLFGFVYIIKKEDDYCIITITVNEKRNNLCVLTISTCLRYIYEFPYNIILFEALKLHKEKDFRYTHILNCILTVGSILNLGLGGGHGLGRDSWWDYCSEHSTFTTRKVIKKKYGNSTCNGIFEFKKGKLNRHRFPYISSTKINFPEFINEYQNRLILYKEFKEKNK